MSSQAAEQFTFDFLPQLPVVVQRRPGEITSDAGLLPLRQFDQRWDYTRRMAPCLEDSKPSRELSLPLMLRQRLFGILAGYEDCNDHDTLRADPVFKLVSVNHQRADNQACVRRMASPWHDARGTGGR